jgi:ornithine cyclodeaminase
MLFVDAATTRRHLSFPPLIEALRRAFVAGCEVPPRHVHDLAPPGAQGTLLLMPAWRRGGRLGLKTVTIFPANRAIAKPALHSTYLLIDAATGEPLAQLDGDEITTRRTAAASALAASFLARADADRLLVVGAGRVGAVMAEALRVVRPIVHVGVWNRSAAAATALAESLAQQGFDAEPCTDLAKGVAWADIVSCATLSTAPLVRGAWLGAGSHLDLVGGFTPTMRESDAACFAGARVYVDTAEALAKAGDLLQAIAEGGFEAAGVQGTLAQLCRGTVGGRGTPLERTLFKSVGTALEDLAAAELVFDSLQPG